MQEEFAVLGIEADHIGRNHISGEVRRESQNALAALPRDAALAIDCHRGGTLILLLSLPIAGAGPTIGIARLVRRVRPPAFCEQFGSHSSTIGKLISQARRMYSESKKLAGSFGRPANKIATCRRPASER
ncbi:hypothetical protein [Bradyrhizobium sp. Pha-3]|uniref:hypothetical protein n=1 Tax=Bradyrhizobium TaxID=374 RepID=UPI0035D4E9A7